MQEVNSLINEIQLGTTLNECIHQNRRSDFGLMLAMLTEDAREFSEFNLPEETTAEKSIDEVRLRHLLAVPAKNKLALADLAEIDQFNEARLIANEQILDIHLKEALSPKALTFKDDVNFIPSDVLNNTSLHSQKRHQLADDKTTKKMSFNAQAWLKNIEQSIVVSQVDVTNLNRVHSTA